MVPVANQQTFDQNLSLSVSARSLTSLAGCQEECDRDGQSEIGYIDVGDGCWRQNMLVTISRCW